MPTNADVGSASTVLIQAQIRDTELYLARHYPFGGQCCCAKALPCPVGAKLEEHRRYLASLQAACSGITHALPLLAARHLPMKVVRHRRRGLLTLTAAKLWFPTPASSRRSR